jgi:predicted DNA-binding ribbon-helix-helix protein
MPPTVVGHFHLVMARGHVRDFRLENYFWFLKTFGRYEQSWAKSLSARFVVATFQLPHQSRKNIVIVAVHA